MSSSYTAHKRYRQRNHGNKLPTSSPYIRRTTRIFLMSIRLWHDL